MNLTELSYLSTVINHLKLVLNTIGRTKTEIPVLKSRLAFFENKFIQGVCDLVPDLTAKDVLNKTLQAKAELVLPITGNELKATLKEDVQKLKQEAYKNSNVLDTVEKAAKNVSSSEGLTVVQPPPDVTVEKEEVKVDPSIGLRLAEEKKKLATKGKRKTSQ